MIKVNEIWRDIYYIENGIEHDYRGKYQVSNFGRVKSLIDNHGNYREKILKQQNANAYLFVNLYKNNKHKQFYTHRLVSHMFLSESYFDGAEVNHKDENPSNNCVNNLEWCTEQYNMNYGARGEKAKGKNNPNLGSLIDRYDIDGNYMDSKYRFEYVKMGFNPSCITHCCKGRNKIHKGYIFKYHTEEEENEEKK